MTDASIDILMEFIESFDLDKPIPSTAECQKELQRFNLDAPVVEIEIFLGKYATFWNRKRK